MAATNLGRNDAGPDPPPRGGGRVGLAIGGQLVLFIVVGFVVMATVIQVALNLPSCYYTPPQVYPTIDAASYLVPAVVGALVARRQLTAVGRSSSQRSVIGGALAITAVPAVLVISASSICI
jgi:hypothetical protein